MILRKVDAAVTISTSTGAINLTPATGSAVVLDGSVNVDGGAVTGVTSLIVSGEASVTTLDIGGTDITATAAELNVLDGALKETNSIWVGNDPSSTTDDAQKNIAVGITALDAVTTGDDVVAIGYDALTDNTVGFLILQLDQDLLQRIQRETEIPLLVQML